MNRSSFESLKAKLLLELDLMLDSKDLSERERESCRILQCTILEYNFENRFVMKGVISRLIVDSVELDYGFLEKFLFFDNKIS